MAVRGWRHVKPGQHTKEVVRAEALSAEAKAILVSQQQQIDQLREVLATMMQAIKETDAERKKGAA